MLNSTDVIRIFEVQIIEQTGYKMLRLSHTEVKRLNYRMIRSEDAWIIAQQLRTATFDV